jgi:hypothetical protein
VKKFAVAVAALVMLTGCGGSKEENPAPQAGQTTQATKSAETTTSAPASTPVATPTKPAVLNAGQLATKMKASVSAKSVKVWTEENDPNKLLGRPNGYTSAATLIDKSLSPCSDPGVDCGAPIEVFATPDEANKRAEYLKSIRTGGILGTEYHTVIGSTLLRVTGELPPKTNTKYAAAFKAAMNG